MRKLRILKRAGATLAAGGIACAAVAITGAATTARAGDASAEIDPHEVYGYWLTKDEEAIFLIEDCGDGTPCGSMRWLNPMITKTYTDQNNPDPELRGRQLIGARVIWGYEKGRKSWKNGNLYHADQGRTYRAKLRRKAEDRLVVKGCVGPICIGQTWTLAAAPEGATDASGDAAIEASNKAEGQEAQ